MILHAMNMHSRTYQGDVMLPIVNFVGHRCGSQCTSTEKAVVTAVVCYITVVRKCTHVSGHVLFVVRIWSRLQ